MEIEWILLMPAARQFWATAGYVLVIALLCLATWLITRYCTNQEWRRKVREHLSDIARETLREAEERAETAEAAAKALTEERNILATEIGAIQQIVSNPLRTTREQLRRTQQ